MSRNPRYDILFEPVQIGPVTAPNRFYQTPFASGAGQQMPHTRAAMREVRAEGGWGVVNTGYCSIHPSSDDAPLPYCRRQAKRVSIQRPTSTTGTNRMR